MVRTDTSGRGVSIATAVVADRRFLRLVARFLALLIVLAALATQATQASATEPYMPWTWGLNLDGQLGDDSTTSTNVPALLNRPNLDSMAAGYYHTLAVDDLGWVWAWGGNYYGQLGDGSGDNSLIPIYLTGISTVTAVSAGGESSMALKSNGTVWTWGANWYGQLGDGTYDDSNVPVQVLGTGGAGFLTNITAIACGGAHMVALKDDGTVWTWGDNWSGQLGDGTWEISLTPVQVSGLTNVTAIAAGYDHTLALKSDGTVWTCGLNDAGQLGDGTTDNCNTPVQASGLTLVSSIGAGSYHSLAVKSDGTPWSWGNNSFGQLGDGTSDNRLVPVPMSGLTDIEAMDGGEEHTVIKATNRWMYACGSNFQGQLGDGTYDDRWAAVRIGVLKKDVSIVGGGWHTVALIEEPIKFTLNVTADYPDRGVVSKDPDLALHTEDSLVTLQASAFPDYLFSGWDGLPGEIISEVKSAGGSTIQFNINEDLDITARFEPPLVWLHYSLTEGGMFLTAIPEPGRHEIGTAVSLKIRESPGYRFFGWEVNGVYLNDNGRFMTTLTQDTTILGIFIYQYTVAVNASPPEGGTVARIPNKFEYDEGEMITLHAEPSEDYAFTGWDGLPAGEISGLSSGDGSLISFNVSEDHNITANFASDTVQLTFVPHAGGDITGDAEGPYPLNSTVNLHAGPNTGYRFVRWLVNGADAGSDPDLELLMNGDKTVEAVFAYQFTLTVINGSGSGTYDEGAEVQIVADYPQEDFDQWTGDVAAVADVFSATTTIIVNGQYTVTAQQMEQPLGVLVETEDDLDWVYQNTPNSMANGGHKVWLEVTVLQWGGNSSVTVTVAKAPASGPGEVTVEDDPGADPLVKWIFGSMRTDGAAESGDLILEVTVTGNVSGEEVVLVPFKVRRLGDVDGNGGPEPGDVMALILTLNGTPPPGYHDKAFDLDANGGAEPGDVQILMNILNGFPVP